MGEALFNPALHTAKARTEQLAKIFDRNPDALLVGSMARIAILGGDPSLAQGRYGTRDIDVTTTLHDTVLLDESAAAPFPVDVAFDGLIRINQSQSAANVRFDARRPDVMVQLPSEVFEPFAIQIHGQTFNTFHPDTMRQLHRICNTGRHKDKASLAQFNEDLEAVSYTSIPDSVFDPLDELNQMVENDSALRRQRTVEYWQSLYYDYVPLPIRLATMPVLKYIKHDILGIAGRKQKAPESLVPDLASH